MTLAALLLLTAQAQAPAQDAGPRIEVRAAPLTKALPEIGQKLGVPMRATPAIGDELLVASFASRDAVAFRDQLAKAFAGEWNQDGNGVWIFNKSSNARAAELKAARTARLEKLRKARDKARAKANPDATFDVNSADALLKDMKTFMAMPRPKDGDWDSKYYSKARDLDARGPSNRVVRRILDRFPLEELDYGGLSTRVVYSTRPTKMQRPMPFDILPEIRRFVQEQNLWAEAMSGSGIDTENAGPMYTSLMYRKERVDKVPAVVTLAVRDQWGQRQIAVKAYDLDGKTILEESESAMSYDSEEGEQLREAQKKNPRKVKLELTPESKAFASLLDYNEARRKEKGVDDAMVAKFLNVTERDPLSYASSEMVWAVARAENRNLLARADDSYLYLGFGVNEPEALKDGMLDATMFDYFMTTTEENGWTRFTPRDLIDSNRSYYDRRDLARALALVAATKADGGRMTVERKAELALLTPDNINEKPMFALIAFLSGNNTWGGNDELLKLYGTLTPDQRRAASTEVGLPLGRLSEPSLAILRKVAFESDEWRLQYNPSEKLQQSFGENGEDKLQELFYGGYLREPTFALPNGLPANGFLKLKNDLTDKVRTGSISRRWGPQDGEIMGPDELAEAWYQAENPKRFPWMQDEWSKKNFENLTLVNQQSVNVEIRFDDRMTTQATLTSDLPIEGGPYTMRTLPQTFREAIAKKLKELEEAYKDQPLPDPNMYQRGNEGGGPPPPPAR